MEYMSQVECLINGAIATHKACFEDLYNIAMGYRESVNVESPPSLESFEVSHLAN